MSNRLSGYSDYSDTRKNLSVRIALLGKIDYWICSIRFVHLWDGGKCVCSGHLVLWGSCRRVSGVMCTFSWLSEQKT